LYLKKNETRKDFPFCRGYSTAFYFYKTFAKAALIDC
jgi:hypothetical protein